MDIQGHISFKSCFLLFKVNNESKETNRWIKKNLLCHLEQAVKKVAVVALMAIGFCFVILAGTISFLSMSLVPNGIETPLWLLSAFGAVASSGLGSILFSKLLNHSLSFWKNYGKREEANKIVKEFRKILVRNPKSRLEDLSNEFFEKIRIMRKWGMLSKPLADELERDCREYRDLSSWDGNRKSVLLGKYVPLNEEKGFVKLLLDDLPFQTESKRYADKIPSSLVSKQDNNNNNTSNETKTLQKEIENSSEQ